MISKVLRHRGVKPYTTINVKPYTIIVQNNKIICEYDGVPFAFDTLEFAQGFAIARDLKDCTFQEMELEQLARICRSSKFPFNAFHIVDDPSQIGLD